jgi:hypothetical protein
LCRWQVASLRSTPAFSLSGLLLIYSKDTWSSQLLRRRAQRGTKLP